MPVGSVVKSLLFVLDDERPVLALVTGDATVDADALARETGAAEVRLARAREVREATGYHPGAVSPCALATAVPVVADPGVFAPEVVYCGAGRRRQCSRSAAPIWTRCSGRADCRSRAGDGRGQPRTPR